MAYRVAVVGATGAVGREILKTLAERNFPVSDIAALASGRSVGQDVSFGDKRVLKIQALDRFDFKGWDIGLFSPGAAVSAIHAPRAAEAGCIVIDNTSQFRMEPDVPLVVPEVNPEALTRIRRGIIANPNCSTIQMVVALKPLHDKFKITPRGGGHLPVGLGRRQGGHGRAVGAEPRHASCTTRRRRRCSPSRSPSTASRTSTSSWMTARPRRSGRWWSRPARSSIPTSRSHATCVRVPVFVGHSESINVEFERPVTAGRGPRGAAQRARRARGR